ncbi:DUF1677 family protein [Melia azedarach]|uniref:DUF1677 family protein n=1 Tax=Melia azedarach TaxID=155640 RepID=A0ACC1XDB7_MELAZ|nr:DUF1677 family protein [Melia azedarach]
MAISGSGSGSTLGSETSKQQTQMEVESVKCESCCFTEDCTPAYIVRVRERYKGRWLCGLCAEAVKDEVLRSDRLISTEEALNRHISFCNKFRSSTSLALTETEHPISAMGKILRKSLDKYSNSSRTPPVRSNSSSVLPDFQKVKTTSPLLLRSESCFSALSPLE